jgi:hypothetical protein
MEIRKLKIENQRVEIDKIETFIRRLIIWKILLFIFLLRTPSKCLCFEFDTP